MSGLKAIKYRAEHSLVLALESIVSAPRYESAVAFGERLGAAAGRMMSKRDRLIVSNLKAAFPEKTDAQVRAIADGVWRNIGRVAVEFIRSREAAPRDADDAVDPASASVVRQAVAEGKGVIFAAGHFCNWEINGVILDRYCRQIGIPFTAIARPMKNPHTGAWLQSKRAEGGTPTILHRQAVKESLRKLRKKEAVGVLFDQNLYTGGIFVPFLGRPAATTPLPALLHGRTGSPVVFTYVLRSGDRFRAFFERVALPEGADETRLEVWSAALNAHLENVIRRDPHLWFWIHNRWKRSGEAAGAGPS